MKYSDGGKDLARASRFPAESVAYIDAPRRAAPAAAKIGDGLIFGLTLARLTRIKLESATRRRAMANSVAPKASNEPFASWYNSIPGRGATPYGPTIQPYATLRVIASRWKIPTILRRSRSDKVSKRHR